MSNLMMMPDGGILTTLKEESKPFWANAISANTVTENIAVEDV